MNITRDIITDLLPLYYSKDCSSDTKSLVDEYLRLNPGFATEALALMKNPLLGFAPKSFDESIEMKALKKTKWLLRLRTIFLVFAILFTLDPFSFSYSEGTVTWLISRAPMTALFYGIFAVIFWTAYILVKRRMRDV